MSSYKSYFSNKISKWALARRWQLFVFDLVLMTLVLMHSLGYFSPFFTISGNFIFLCAILLGVTLLGLRSKHLYIIALIFLCVSAFFLISGIEVWADRVMIYFAQSFMIGFILMCSGLVTKK